MKSKQNRRNKSGIGYSRFPVIATAAGLHSNLGVGSFGKFDNMLKHGTLRHEDITWRTASERTLLDLAEKGVITESIVSTLRKKYNIYDVKFALYVRKLKEIDLKDDEQIAEFLKFVGNDLERASQAMASLGY